MLFIAVILALLTACFIVSSTFSSLGMIIFAISFALLLVIFAAFYLIQDKIALYWPVIPMSGFLVLGLSILWLVSNNIWAKFIFLFFSLGLIGYLFFNLYNLNYHPRLWSVEGFKGITCFFTFLTSFYFFVAVGALNFFLKIPLIELELILFPLLCWLAFYNFWFKKPRPNFFIIFVFALLGLECYLVLGFLPLGFYLASFLSSLFFSLIFFFVAFPERALLEARGET